jgi:chemotaxis protein methyltransferase CheR
VSFHDTCAKQEGIVAVTDVDYSLSQMDAREFKLFRELVHAETGIWLRDGKQVMLASRLSRRLRHHGLDSFSEYYKHVKNCRDGGAELGELINCVTTNKTSFFREPHHFDFLAETMVPEIQAAAARGGPKKVSIWSAASSTGEEPYSIAMTLLESLRKPGVSGWDIRIAASDIDTNVLATAARGVYPEEFLASVPEELRKKYFLRGKEDMLGSVKVRKEVASLVEFQRINLMDRAWPLRGSFDAIFFRNALIYFNQDTQDIFLRKMASYLKPRGYLFLGHSEHVPWLHAILEPLNKTMYRLRDSR